MKLSHFTKLDPLDLQLGLELALGGLIALGLMLWLGM